MRMDASIMLACCNHMLSVAMAQGLCFSRELPGPQGCFCKGCKDLISVQSVHYAHGCFDYACCNHMLIVAMAQGLGFSRELPGASRLLLQRLQGADFCAICALCAWMLRLCLLQSYVQCCNGSRPYNGLTFWRLLWISFYLICS